MATDHCAVAVEPWTNVEMVQLASSAVALGNFDGVHLGHAGLISLLVKRSQEFGVPPSVLILWPHPRIVLAPSEPMRLLTTLGERAAFLRALGVEGLYLWPFSEEASTVEPRRFIEDVVVRHLSPRLVVVGVNHRFGRGASGTPRDLGLIGERAGFEAVAVNPVTMDGDVISSTRVRKALTGGRVEEARMLLGRPYALSGTVLPGDRRGRLLGFPTANVHPDPKKVWPEFGVYAALARVAGGEELGAVVNFGPRPTVDGTILAEVHLLDFHGDLYGESLEVSFLKRLRSQRRFPSLEDLARQIGRDVEGARHVLARDGA